MLISLTKSWKSSYTVGSLMQRNWTGVAMAGLAAEGLQYDKVVGQSADLFTLQRLINRSKPQLSKEQQQNLTRWAVSVIEKPKPRIANNECRFCHRKGHWKFTCPCHMNPNGHNTSQFPKGHTPIK
ncbi:hypothetical protein HYC85_005039 [Camellia sinensis]|uniref:CCHC-type domain-containing protein n=1 Tax=Camellia sinensis TaxID=4442 RepID=A0A7J7I073_CAMSI|nr:hypothetical protein HYC85_005039 [Camellia sinensis]